MTRFALLQSRMQILVALVGLIAGAIVLGITGPHLVDLYNSSVAHCQTDGDCQTSMPIFLSTDHLLANLSGLLVTVVPGLVGIFWGAPLVARELDTGTFRLAWTQGVTRTRWMVTKLVVVGVISLAAAGLASLAVTWWSSPLDRANATRYGVFEQRDIVPLAYALFALALGVALGLLIRRTLPAMAATLAGFVFVRIAVTQWIRPNLISPLHKSLSLNSAASVGFSYTPQGATFQFSGVGSIPNSWTLSSHLVNSAGVTPSAAAIRSFVATACPNLPTPPAIQVGGGHLHATPAPNATAFHDCLTALSNQYHLVATYQPPSHYWPLQWAESGIFVAAALALCGFSVWWIRRRA